MCLVSNYILFWLIPLWHFEPLIFLKLKLIGFKFNIHTMVFKFGKILKKIVDLREFPFLESPVFSSFIFINSALGSFFFLF